jgi:hypothetical protein
MAKWLLIAPLFGSSSPEQINSPEVPTISENIKQTGDTTRASSSSTASGASSDSNS